MSRIDNEARGERREPRAEEIDAESSPVIDGEIIEIYQPGESLSAKIRPGENEREITKTKRETTTVEKQKINVLLPPSNQKYLLQYLVLPLIFLTVALLGGLRFGALDREFIFLRPELVCLVFASILLAIFFRSGLLHLGGWFSERFSTVKNFANAVVLLTLYAASVQIFNSLLPEKGLLFWVIGFFFFWTLWNNLFSVFDAKRLLQSLSALFGLAFAVKYLLLANLVSQNETWTQKIFEGLVREASFGLLDLPKFAPATGYAQFFALALYVIGLFLLRPQTDESKI